MTTRGKSLALAGLLISQGLGDLIGSSSGDLSLNDSYWPGRVDGSVIRKALESPIAVHNTSAAGPKGSTGNYTYTSTVIEVPLNDTDNSKNQVSSQILISLHSSSNENLTDIEACTKVWALDYNQTFFDSFAHDTGDCTTGISDACLSNLRQHECTDNSFSASDECPFLGSAVSWNSTAASVLSSDAIYDYYSTGHDKGNITDTEALTKMIFPVISGWKDRQTGNFQTNVYCLRAKGPEDAPTATTSTSAPTSAPTTTSSSSSHASPTAVVKAEVLLGAAAAIAGYMAC
ncbi:hypothetical protein SUNI508_04979 [Seiridium unicorne]|uniref:Uncharacterized protein n=1 Tax=Seiridium unicorne TaxID=138068 RepID=A0ABR2V5W4_9PEZI